MKEKLVIGSLRGQGCFFPRTLEQAFGNRTGAAALNLVVPHGDPFDVRGHQAQGAGGVAGGESVVEVADSVCRGGGHG